VLTEEQWEIYIAKSTGFGWGTEAQKNREQAKTDASVEIRARDWLISQGFIPLTIENLVGIECTYIDAKLLTDEQKEAIIAAAGSTDEYDVDEEFTDDVVMEAPPEIMGAWFGEGMKRNGFKLSVTQVVKQTQERNYPEPKEPDSDG
jgi:hypothetical protein